MALSGASFMPRFTFENKVTWGNLLTFFGMVVGGLFAFFALQANVDASARDIVSINSTLAPVADAVDTLETRMALVERNQQIGREQREAFQDQATTTLELLRQQNLSILNQLSAITARLDAQDRATR